MNYSARFRVFALLFAFVAIAHAQDDEEMDEEEAMELRNSLTWGRVFLDNAVTHHQYFKARFGGDIPTESHNIIYADPPLGCTMPKNDVKDKVVFVDRGECTFTTKARLMQKAGAAAMMVVGHDSALTHLPGPDGTDIELPVGMVTGEYGGYIKALTARQESKATMIPIHCEKESGVSVCLPVTAAEKAAHAVAEGGHLTVGSEKFEFLTAKFGTPMPANALTLGVADPINACTELDAEKYKGQAVLVKRGGCPFLDKVSNVQRAGAAASILINTQPGILRMDSLKRYESYNITIAAAMITTTTGEKMSGMGGKEITFVHSDVTASVWDGLRNSVTAEQWPLDFEESKEMFLKLKNEHATSPERIEFLENAFRDTGMEAEEYLDAGDQEL
jgi:hypothetical protein